MKKRKLLFLLTAILALSVPLSACDGAESSSGKQGAESHAMTEYFAWAGTSQAYSTQKRYDGTVLDVDEEHNLVVYSTQTYNTDGSISDEVKVVDMLENWELINHISVTNPAGVDPNLKQTVEVEFDYPMVKATYNTPTYNSEYGYYENNYTYNYYLLSKTGYTSYGGEGDWSVTKHYSLYEIEIGDRVLWVNEDLEVLRSYKSVQTNGYATPDFDASYGNYLYDWEFSETNRVIQVYNMEGVPSVQYTFPSDVGSLGLISEPVVLNNGNILVQEHVLAEDDATDYTYKMLSADPYTGMPAMLKAYMTTKIIDYKTGVATEIDFDYAIMSLEAAYADGDTGAFPFALAEGAQNQAYVAKIVNQELSTFDYVALDNECKVEYTFQNEWVKGQSSIFTMMMADGSGYNTIQKINDDYYAANVYVGEDAEVWLFDLDGNKVAALPYTVAQSILDDDDERTDIGITDQYIVTPYGIYDFNKTLVYDFETGALFDENAVMQSLNVMDNAIMAFKINGQTFEYELYEFDDAKKDFVKAEGEIVELSMKDQYDFLPEGNDITVRYTLGFAGDVMSAQSYTWTLYKADGEPLLRLQVEDMEDVIKGCKDVAYVETTIDGKDVFYVVK